MLNDLLQMTHPPKGPSIDYGDITGSCLPRWSPLQSEGEAQL